MTNNKQVQRTRGGMFLYGEKGATINHLLEETGSSKGSDSSLAELGQSLIG